MTSAEPPTLVQQLGRMAATTTVDTLPAAVVDAVPGRVLDVLGICVAALDLDTSVAVLDLVAADGGTPAATAIGLPDRLPAAQAAFANGVLAHSLDYDDTHLPSILHPSASVVPATLAVGEWVGATGADVMAAIVVGIEVTVRLGMAGYLDEPGGGGRSEYFEHGQHATSICGAIGSAAAASRLVTGTEQSAADAMAVAASMASGIIEANRTGGTVKRIHCGWAAHAGVTAARLVDAGLTGAPTALEGRFGLFQAFLRDQWRAEAVTDGLGETWCLRDVFTKPYPANHFTHAAIDAALRLRAAGLDPNDVTSIHVGVPTPIVRTIGEPLAAKQRPDSGYQAQFSAPFAVAAALLAGSGRAGSGLGLGLGDFTDERAHDPAHRALMARVTVGPDARCDSIYPRQFPAVLTVATNDGRTLTEAVLVNRGGPDDPLSDEELATKFADNVTGRLADPIGLVDAVAKLAALDTLEPVLSPLRSVRP